MTSLIFEQLVESAVQRCSWEKVFRGYAANLQENTDVKECFATLLKLQNF